MSGPDARLKTIVARQHGLDGRAARLLVGETVEELEGSAAALQELLRERARGRARSSRSFARSIHRRGSREGRAATDALSGAHRPSTATPRRAREVHRLRRRCQVGGAGFAGVARGDADQAASHGRGKRRARALGRPPPNESARKRWPSATPDFALVSYAALIVSVTVYHRDAASGVRVRRRRGEAAPAFPVRLLQRRGEGPARGRPARRPRWRTGAAHAALGDDTRATASREGRRLRLPGAVLGARPLDGRGDRGV